MELRVNTAEELKNAIENAQTPVTVILAEGVYEIAQALTLTSHLTIKGEGQVTLKGTKRIPLEGKFLGNGIVKLSLAQLGIFDTGSFGLGPYRDYWKEHDVPKPHLTDQGPSLALYYEDKKMTLSRYPRRGMVKIQKALGKTPTYYNGTQNGTEEGIFIPAENRFLERNDLDNMLLVGYWAMDWATQRHQIASYNKETRVLEVKPPYHVYGYRDGGSISGEVGGNFYALNVLTEVKQPGDWYIDRKTNTLYVYPYEGQSYLDISVCENLFEGKNIENVTLENIEIFGARKSAFQFENCQNIKIQNCSMHDLGAWGAILENCTDSLVSHCHVYNTAGGGIAMSGGERSTLTGGDNFVVQNQIHNIANWHKMYMPAVEINGVGITVQGNEIYQLPHAAIIFHGNNHVIEGNRIKEVCLESNDSGAIYAGRDYSCRGNIIRHNHLSDLEGFEKRGCIGIYFDDGMCSAEVYGNVFVNLPHAAILLGGGRDFDIHDNFFYQCRITLRMDDRLARWSDGNQKLVKRLEKVPYKSEVWQKAYPHLYNILEDEPLLPKYNQFHHNKTVGGFGATLFRDYLLPCLAHFDNEYIETEERYKLSDYEKQWTYLI